MVELKKPYISVIIIAFKRKQFLKDCVNSIINQTVDRGLYEIIVVKNFRDLFIDEFLENTGVKAIYSTTDRLGIQIREAFEVSNGEIITFLDDDDRFVENKLDFIYKEFRMDPELTYLHNEQDLIDAEGVRIEDKRHIKGTVNKRVFPDPTNALTFGMLVASPRIFHNNSSITIGRRLMKQNFNNLEQIRSGLDLFLFSCAVASGVKAAFVPDQLTEYRVHSSESKIETVTANALELTASLLRKWQNTIPVIAEISSGTLLWSYIMNLRDLFNLRMAIVNKKATLRVLLKLDLLKIAKNRLYLRSEAAAWVALYALGIIFPVLSRSLYLRLRSVFF